MQKRNILSFLKKYVQYKDISFLMQKVLDQNHEIYLAGGCVRDALLGRLTKDFDFATSATPEQIESLFDKTLDYGKKFGTIAVVLNDVSYEVTTYRSEGTYLDYRHPEQVKFAKTYEQDSERRDFTINALYADLQGQVYDPQGGLKDLEAKLINCVNYPADRFREDALRMYRALRFACDLNFKIEDQTFKDLVKFWNLTQKLSKERVYSEFKKTVQSVGFTSLIESLLSQGLHPKGLEINEIKDISFFKARMAQAWPKDSRFRVFVFEVLYFTHENLEEAIQSLEVLQNQMSLTKIESQWIKKGLRFLFSINKQSEVVSLIQGNQLLELNEVKLLFSSDLPRHKKYDKEKREGVFKLANQYTQLPLPLVSARDLIKQGLVQGPELGKTLERAYELQISKNLNQKENILSLLDLGWV